jgi:hypothetical protein
MVEVLNFNTGTTITKLKATVTNLNVQAILMSHCERDKNTEYKHITAYSMIHLDTVRKICYVSTVPVIIPFNSHWAAF